LKTSDAVGARMAGIFRQSRIRFAEENALFNSYRVFFSQNRYPLLRNARDYIVRQRRTVKFVR